MADYGKGLAKERAKVLITGCSQKIISEVEGYIGGEYRVEKCPAKGDMVSKTLKKVKPDIMMICLHDENNDIYKNYGCLITEMDWAGLPIIVAGEDDDCFEFKCKLPVEKLDTISLPLDKTMFLNQFRRMAERSMQKMPWEDIGGNDEFNSLGDEFDIYGGAAYDYEIESKMTADSVPADGYSRPVQLEERKCILVVDDDVQMLNTIKMYLEELYDVVVVPSGKLALKYLERKKADLVLLDYMMPDMDGPGVLKEIRKNSSSADLPVIFLTGVSDKDEVMRGLGQRPNSYLLKPVSKEMLRDRVISILLGIL